MRYTLIYTAKDGTKVTCYNLLKTGVDSIINAQLNLGSYDFAYEAQPHNYSQYEIELIRR